MKRAHLRLSTCVILLAMTGAAFAQAPDDPTRIIRPDGRDDELGFAERELAGMQAELQKTLGEQKHLANLGLAVSKINHDMRNILTSARLVSDRLAMVKDPSVQAFAPKLVRTLDRAVGYTEGVLAYGRAQEAPPARRRLRLRLLVEEVEGLLGLETEAEIEFLNAVEHAMEVDADAEQLFRVALELGQHQRAQLLGSKRPASELNGAVRSHVALERESRALGMRRGSRPRRRTHEH